MNNFLQSDTCGTNSFENSICQNIHRWWSCSPLDCVSDAEFCLSFSVLVLQSFFKLIKKIMLCIDYVAKFSAFIIYWNKQFEGFVVILKLLVCYKVQQFRDQFFTLIAWEQAHRSDPLYHLSSNRHWFVIIFTPVRSWYMLFLYPYFGWIIYIQVW